MTLIFQLKFYSLKFIANNENDLENLIVKTMGYIKSYFFNHNILVSNSNRFLIG
jgi:hypothetical protein